MSAEQIVPLITGSAGAVLAGFFDDDGHYPALSKATGGKYASNGESDYYPLVIVAEPDILNNYGFAQKENALAATALVHAMTNGQPMPISFDLTLNGHGRTSNLLTLAFTPPFLAATLCLLLAAIVIGWRAFLRFGPASKAERAIAFGKAELVANSAGLIRRTKRLHLVTYPYADHVQDKIVRALAINQPGSPSTEAAIDRAQETLAPDASPFSAIIGRLRAAKRPHQAVTAAHELHAIERKLIPLVTTHPQNRRR